MWRGPTVAHQKEVNGKARAKIFSLHAKLIALAARSGDDPSANPALFEAIAKARKENVPNDNIDRAIARGSGKDKDASEIVEMIYEGYSAGGVAVVVMVLTDNRNRTAPNMRHIFSRSGGNLGETGSISGFAFDFVGVLSWELWDVTPDAFEELLLETNARDYTINDEHFEVITPANELMATRNILASLVTIDYAEREYRPKSPIELDDFDKVLKLYTLLSDLGDDEDVSSVAHTATIAPDIWQRAHDMVESQKFRT